jgi:hypothetical protein
MVKHECDSCFGSRALGEPPSVAPRTNAVATPIVWKANAMGAKFSGDGQWKPMIDNYIVQ